MAEYQRLISYIYSYTEAGKDVNAGFARMELRNGQWRITINIRIHNEEELTAYLFQRIEGKMLAVPIGKLQIKGGSGILRTQTEEQNVCGTSLPMKQFQGIVISGQRSTFYGTAWDEEGIEKDRIVLMDAEEFRKNVQAKLHHHAELVNREERKRGEEDEKIESVTEQSAETDRTAVMETVAAELNTEKTVAEEMIKGMKEYQMEVVDKDTVEVVNSIQEEAGETAESDFDTVLASDLESQSVAELQNSAEFQNSIEFPNDTDMQNKAKIRDAMESLNNTEGSEDMQPLEKVLQNFPKMYPFEDDEILDCVRLELQDLSSLPMKNWVLANNSFLLHGFYCYRHLILVKRKDANGEYIYQMGIPGIHHMREEHVAHMFGFDDFKSIRNTKEKAGEFGYWWISVKNQENSH